MQKILTEPNHKKLVTAEKYFFYFIIYSILGWVYEVLLEMFVFHHGFVNRGILFGPYCPVYGVGALLFLLFFHRAMKADCKSWLKKIRPILIFLGCMAVATLIELFASYILEAFTGGWPWDYFHYNLNFQGRIALNTSLRFGLGGVFFLYVIQPLLEKITNKMKENVLNMVTGCIAILFSCDLLMWLTTL